MHERAGHDVRPRDAPEDGLGIGDLVQDVGQDDVVEAAEPLERGQGVEVSGDELAARQRPGFGTGQVLPRPA